MPARGTDLAGEINHSFGSIDIPISRRQTASVSRVRDVRTKRVMSAVVLDFVRHLIFRIEIHRFSILFKKHLMFDGTLSKHKPPACWYLEGAGCMKITVRVIQKAKSYTRRDRKSTRL